MGSKVEAAASKASPVNTAPVRGVNPKRQRVDDGSASISGKVGSDIELFHYNGLSGTVKGEKRGGVLTKCKIYKRVIVVGVTSGLPAESIDKVIQTKWDGCEIEWENGKAGNVNG